MLEKVNETKKQIKAIAKILMKYELDLMAKNVKIKGNKQNL